MAERPLQVGDRVRGIGETDSAVGVVVESGLDGRVAVRWPNGIVGRPATRVLVEVPFVEHKPDPVLATLDDGVEVRRGRDVPEGWEWRYGDSADGWRFYTDWIARPAPGALVECRPKPPETVTIELPIEDTKRLATFFVSAHAAAVARDALEERSGQQATSQERADG